MKGIRLIFYLGLLLTSLNALAREKAFTAKKSLSKDWRIYQNDKFEAFTNQKNVHTVYLFIDANKFGGDYLEVNSVRDFTLFVNGKLASISGHQFNIDSLAKIFASTSLLIGIHQKNISTSTLETFVETPVPQTGSLLEPIGKPPTFLRDFVIVASMILLIILIILIRLNPKLASDYFSIARIFSLREADDSQIYTRIGNSTNILFYIFCSLILGFYLIIIFHFISPGYYVTSYIHATSFFTALAQWIGISLIILTVFFLKIMLVYLSSNLFGSKELAGIHFFNWVRLLLIVFSFMSVVLFFYFILRGHNTTVHSLLLNFIAWCLTGWIVIIFLKLRGRGSYSIFHLFSYICATEIIPLIIIITVLYN